MSGDPGPGPAGDGGRDERARNLARIFEAVPFGILLVDRATDEVLAVNARWSEMFGARPGPGQSGAEVTRRYRFEHPDGTPIPPDQLALPTALRTGQRVELKQDVTLLPDGTRIPVVVTAIPLSLSGGPGHDAAIVVVQDQRDIARAFEELRDWEERFESVVETNRQVVYDFDRVQEIVRWSRSVKAVLGYDRDTMLGDPYFAHRLMHPEDRQLVEAVLSIGLSGLRPDFEVEYRMRHADGRWLIVHDRGRVSYDASGRPVRILGTIVDVTAQRELERRLEHTQRLETVGTLAGGIAHDFNNQLTAMIGHLDLLAEHLVGHADAAAHVPPARLAAQRCADLTRSLLAFSRKMSPQMSVVSPETLVREALLFAGRSLPPSVRIVTELEPEPWPVEADAGQIEQVLLNLFVNARDAMDGAGELRVTLRNVDVDPGRARFHPGARRGPFVEIGVADTGSGIHAEILPRIFEPFFTTKGVGQGTGLGLSMAHGIVHSHRGWIEVESVPGERTWFRVLLPRAAGAVGGAPAARPAVPAGTEAVLVVDDEALVRDMIEIALTAAGHRVASAVDGTMALETFGPDGREFALAIVDVMLPDMSGLQVMEALHARRPGLPVLLASGYSAEGLPEEARARAAGFLAKPFGVVELKAAIRHALDRAAGAGPAAGSGPQAAPGPGGPAIGR